MLGFEIYTTHFVCALTKQTLSEDVGKRYGTINSQPQKKYEFGYRFGVCGILDCGRLRSSKEKCIDFLQNSSVFPLDVLIIRRCEII